MRRPFPALLVLSLMLLVPPALRAENEVYGGLGLGYSSYKLNSPDFEAATFATREFLGLSFGDYWGIEAGYHDFGTAKDRVAVAQGQPSLNYEVESSGYDLSLLGRYPLNEELVAFGRLGMIRWDSTATLDEVVQFSVSDEGTDLITGLGLDFRGSDRFHVRVEAEFVFIEYASSWWVLTTSLVYGIPFGQ